MLSQSVLQQGPLPLHGIMRQTTLDLESLSKVSVQCFSLLPLRSGVGKSATAERQQAPNNLLQLIARE
jgi:hypothetical protein